MSITSDLEQILSARYGKDVRQAIHDSIEEGYNIAVQAQGIAETSQESAKAYAQAALASEQAAEDYMELAEQYKNEAFSGTPTGYADLVAKVNSIYRQTATSYSIVGTSEGSALAHTIYGMSVQDGTPTPSVPVDIKSAKADFRCVGKNLMPYPYYRDASYTENGITYTVNNDGLITVNGTATGTSFYVLYNTVDLTPYKNYILKKGQTFRIVMEVKNCQASHGVSMFVNYNNSDKVGIRNKQNGKYTTTFTVTDDITTRIAISLYLADGDTHNNTSISIMLTLADADQTYEPYQHTDVTTDLNLRAIEVQSTDNYNLVKEGKYYIADTIDWSEDRGYVITRRIKREVFDGSEDEVINLWNNTTGSTQRRFAIKLSSFPKFITNASDIVERWQGIANYLQKAPSSSSMNYEFGYYAFQCITPDSDYRFSVYDYMTSPRFSSVTEFKTWLASNNLTFDYALATPTTEPITSEQAQALLSLKTYDEATSISATGDIEPSVDLEYSKDRNTALALTGHNLAHKNALKLNDINTALIELGGN